MSKGEKNTEKSEKNPPPRWEGPQWSKELAYIQLKFSAKERETTNAKLYAHKVFETREDRSVQWGEVKTTEGKGWDYTLTKKKKKEV